MSDFAVPDVAVPDVAVTTAVPGTVARPRARPVIYWALLGAAQLALMAYCIIRWGLSGEMHSTSHGPDQLPTWATVAMYILEVNSFLTAFYVIKRFLVEPARRAGRITNDGMMLIAWFAVMIPSDIGISYAQYTFTYNSYYTNVGSWLGEVPGVVLPNAHLIPDPLLIVIPAFMATMFGATVVGSWVMGRIAARWPAMPTVGLLALTLLFFAVADLAMEYEGILLKIDAYPAVIRAASLFPGKTYQFPLYQLPLQGAVWTAAAALRFFRDDQGRTVVERGVDRLRVSERRRRLMQQSALIGVFFALMTAFNLAWLALGVEADQPVRNLPSYFQNGVCGPSTNTPCVGSRTPLYRSPR